MLLSTRLKCCIQKSETENTGVFRFRLLVQSSSAKISVFLCRQWHPMTWHGLISISADSQTIKCTHFNFSNPNISRCDCKKKRKRVMWCEYSSYNICSYYYHHHLKNFSFEDPHKAKKTRKTRTPIENGQNNIIASYITLQDHHQTTSSSSP